MRSFKGGLLVALLVATVTASTIDAPAAGAIPPPPKGYKYLKVGAALNRMDGFTWYHGKDQVIIKGWKPFDQRKHGRQWWPKISVVHPCYLPACKPSVSPKTADGGDVVMTFDATNHTKTATMQYSPRFVRRHRKQEYGSAQPTTETAMRRGSDCGHWYEPWTWCWSDILKKIWDNVVLPCAYGTAGFTGKKYVETTAAKIMTSGAAVTRWLGPDGWAATAIAGCLFGVLFRRLPAGSPPPTQHLQLDRRVA